MCALALPHKQYQNSSAEADARADAAREEARQLQARLDASQQSGGDVGKGGDAGAGDDAGGGGGDTALAAKAEQLQAELVRQQPLAVCCARKQDTSMVRVSSRATDVT